MSAKTPGKGSSLLMSIASVYTAVPGLVSLDVDGEESGTFDGKTLDGPVHPEMPPTGYVVCPTISGEVFWDSANVVHLALKALMRAQVATNFKVTDAATVPVSTVWSVTGVALGEKFAMEDGVKAPFKLQTSGNPS